MTQNDLIKRLAASIVVGAMMAGSGCGGDASDTRPQMTAGRGGDGGSSAAEHGPPFMRLTSGGTVSAGARYRMTSAIGEPTGFRAAKSSEHDLQDGVIRLNYGGGMKK